MSSGEDTIGWLVPWNRLVGPQEGLSRELFNEIGPRHMLNGVKVRAIAHRQDRDDFLFELLDGSGRLAVVHLTYANHPEPDPRWPNTEIYADLSRFEQERMRPDAANWQV